MGFQIKNQQGKAINISHLDIEAAEFWGKTLDLSCYADPAPAFVNSNNLVGIELTKAKIRHEIDKPANWFDMIGWIIHDSHNPTWESVINEIGTADRHKPYIDLINYWDKKGYTPHRVDW